MASGTIGGEEQPREKHKWSENSKVYTRKIFRTNKNNNPPNPTFTITTAITTNTTNTQPNENNNINIIDDKVDKFGDNDSTKNNDLPDGITAVNDKNESDNDRNMLVSPKEPIDVGNLSEPEKNSSRLETVSEDSLTLDRPEAPVSNGHDVKLATDGIIAVNDKNESENDRNMLVSPKEPIDVGKSEPEKNSSRLETVSEDSLTLDRPKAPVSNGHDVKLATDGIIAVNDKNESENDQNMLVSPKEPIDVGNLSEPEKNSSRLETVSEDSLMLDRPEAPVSNGHDVKLATDGITAVNDKNESGIDRNMLVSPKEPIDVGNLSEPEKNSSRLETVSEDSLTLDRPEAPVSNEHDVKLANKLVRPVVTRVDDRVSISVSAASLKQEVRELKRKLESQLDQVRKMTKRLEAKELQLSGYTDGGVDLDGGGHLSVSPLPVVVSLQYPVNGRLEKGLSGSARVNSEMSSVGYSDSRPFRHLSVSVMDNHHGIGEIVEKEKRTPKANQYYRNSEFLLGKEKLPPAESNKKPKSAGGKRHGGREYDFGFGIDKQIFKSCSNLLQRLMKHKHGWVFNQAVDVKRLGLHDYFDIIKHPMDLGTVKTRLTKNWYKTPREFAEDVRLTFHNAMTYNPVGQDVHVMAEELLRIFEDKWPAIECEYDRKLRYDMIDLGVPTPTSRKTYAPAHAFAPVPVAPPFLHQPPPFQEARHLERSQSMLVPPESRSKPVYSGGRTPAPKKPKAKDPHKRDMTFEEKQRLSTNLQSLPSEKLDDIVRIIKKRNSALSQHDDEIEVDIDSVDAETLWELDRFVTNYKKSLSKNKRKAELLQARAAAAQAYQESIPAPTNIKKTKETRQDEGNVATSPRDQQEKHSDGGSGTSSSSSSSSDSGSSSSDSDSDSSSGCGSDGGQ